MACEGFFCYGVGVMDGCMMIVMNWTGFSTEGSMKMVGLPDRAFPRECLFKAM